MLQLISQTLFGEYRRHVLGLLLLHPEQSYHVREIARLTGTVAGTLHKELKQIGKRRYFVASAAWQSTCL